MAEPQQPVDQQVTSITPATKQKNPKRVAAGKAIAERTRIAREEQKKALIQAQSIITSNNNTMAERYQHHRFIGGGLLQTRRDQKCFCQKSRAAISCFAYPS